MLWYESVALGCAGGMLPDILRIIHARYGGVPKYLYRIFFWFSLCLLAALGGLACFLLRPERIIDALAIGFSAPAILSELLGKKAITADREHIQMEALEPLLGQLIDALRRLAEMETERNPDRIDLNPSSKRLNKLQEWHDDILRAKLRSGSPFGWQHWLNSLREWWGLWWG